MVTQWWSESIEAFLFLKMGAAPSKIVDGLLEDTNCMYTSEWGKERKGKLTDFTNTDTLNSR